MGKMVTSAAAVWLGLAVAGPATAQQYYGNSNQRYDSYDTQRDRDYRDQGYRDQNYRDDNSRDRRDGSGRQQNRRAAEVNLDIESALQARGYNVGTVDGTIDAQARAGIRAYQRDAGLDPNGQTSTQLLSHIETNNLRAGGAAAGQTDLGAAAGQVIQGILNNRR